VPSCLSSHSHGARLLRQSLLPPVKSHRARDYGCRLIRQHIPCRVSFLQKAIERVLRLRYGLLPGSLFARLPPTNTTVGLTAPNQPVCLRRYTWDKARQNLKHYRRRTPEASVLYQAVYHASDSLQSQWEERFQQQYGCLRDEVIKCRNYGALAHGAARVYCDGCKHSLLIAFSRGATRSLSASKIHEPPEELTAKCNRSKYSHVAPI
jgi:hypothetical protein